MWQNNSSISGHSIQINISSKQKKGWVGVLLENVDCVSCNRASLGVIKME